MLWLSSKISPLKELCISLYFCFPSFLFDFYIIQSFNHFTFSNDIIIYNIFGGYPLTFSPVQISQIYTSKKLQLKLRLFLYISKSNQRFLPFPSGFVKPLHQKLLWKLSLYIQQELFFFLYLDAKEGPKSPLAFFFSFSFSSKKASTSSHASSSLFAFIPSFNKKSDCLF